MTLLWVFVRGLVLGLSIAAPVGPIGLLCIRRTLAQGRRVGLLSGCGAATADAFYGVVAAFGLTTLSNQLVSNAGVLKLSGGLFLCYLGLKTVFAHTPHLEQAHPTQAASTQVAPMMPRRIALIPAYTTTLVLTLTNPVTIFSFLAIFASLGITQANHLESVTLVFGVFSGSLLWWLVLVSGVAYLRSRLTPQRLNRFNRWSSRFFGVVLVGFGLKTMAGW